MEQCSLEADTLMQKEAEESRLLGELQNKLSELLEFVRKREDEIMTKERRLSSYVEECDEQITEIRKDGERRIALIRNEKASLEVEVDKLVANRPKLMEQWAKEVDDLRTKNDEEMKLAEIKVRAMLEGKKSVLEGALAKLLNLRNDTSTIERELDEARKKKLSQSIIDHEVSDDYRAHDGQVAREDIIKPKATKSRMRESITRTLSKSLSKKDK